jgi:hypothetical protein
MTSITSSVVFFHNKNRLCGPIQWLFSQEDPPREKSPRVHVPFSIGRGSVGECYGGAIDPRSPHAGDAAMQIERAVPTPKRFHKNETAPQPCVCRFEPGRRHECADRALRMLAKITPTES